MMIMVYLCAAYAIAASIYLIWSIGQLTANAPPGSRRKLILILSQVLLGIALVFILIGKQAQTPWKSRDSQFFSAPTCHIA
jgi:small neutral amino acid transporter SnatA (MarC family)